MDELDDRRGTAHAGARGVTPPRAYSIADGPVHPGAATLVLEGELDLAAAGPLRARIDETSGPLVLDLAGVTFVDSAILRELLRSRERLVLSAAPQPVRRLLDLTGTAELFELAPDVASALKRRGA